MAKEPTRNQPDETIFSVSREVGRILAEARKEQNLSIEQVAAKIHIRQRYLIDLEQGDLSDLPGRAYILGFIRTYARLLNLDGEELIRRMGTLASLPNYERSQAPTLPPSEEEPNFPILLASGVFIFLIAVGSYFFLAPSPIETPPLDNSDDHSPISAQRDLTPPKSSPEDVPEDPLEDSPSRESPLESPKDPPQESLTARLANPRNNPGENRRDNPRNNPAESNARSGGGNSEPSAPSVQDLKAPVPPLKKIVLKAKEPCWIELRNENGHLIFMKLLKRSEEYEVPQSPGVALSVGNAGGVDVFLGETKLPPLGARGAVKRGIRLETLQ